MGCILQRESPAQKRKREKEEKAMLREEELNQQASEELKKELAEAMEKVTKKQNDLEREKDWGLLDAEVHSSEHLRCHEATLYNNMAAAENFIELCIDTCKKLQKQSSYHFYKRVKSAQADIDQVTSQIKTIQSAAELKMKEYATYWVQQVCVPQRERRHLVSVLSKWWPAEFSYEQYSAQYEHLDSKYEEHVKECDDGVSKKWDMFRDERNACLAELFGRINKKCDELQEKYDVWRQANSNYIEVKSSDGIQHKTPVEVWDDKRDRVAFKETDTIGNRELFLEWSGTLQTEFAKLEGPIQSICKKVYAKHYGEEEMPHNVSHVKLSPALNIGALSDEHITCERSSYVELTPEEYRLDEGRFKSDAERLEYMRSMNKVNVALHAGRRAEQKYKRVFTQYSAQKVKVEALYRRSSEVGWNGLNFIVFPGGSCLDGVDLSIESSNGPRVTKSKSKKSVVSKQRSSGKAKAVPKKKT